MNEIYVRGCARWIAEHGPPRGETLPPMLRRRCSLGTRAAADAIAELVGHGLVIADAAIVHGTALGEITTTVDLLDMLRDSPPSPSPTKFATSVHNAAMGQLAIALGHTGRSTTVSSGAHTVAAAWLEAIATLRHEAEHVLLVVVDEPMPPRLVPHHDGVVVAWWLARDPGVQPTARVRWMAPARDVPTCEQVPAPLAHAAVRFAWPIAVATSTAEARATVQMRLEPDDERGHAASLVITRVAESSTTLRV